MFFKQAPPYRFPSNIVYVDSKAPTSKQDGTFARPYKTLTRAIKKVNKLSSVTNPWGILLSPGRYKVNETLEVTAPGVSIQGFDHSSSRIVVKDNITGLHLRSDTNFHKLSFVGGSPAILVTAPEYVRASYCYFDDSIGPSVIVNKGSTQSFGLTESRFSNCGVGISIRNGSEAAIATTIFHGSGNSYNRKNVGVELTDGAEGAITNSLITNCSEGIRLLSGSTMLTTACAIKDSGIGIMCDNSSFLASSGFLLKNGVPAILTNESFCDLLTVTVVGSEGVIQKDAASQVMEKQDA